MCSPTAAPAIPIPTRPGRASCSSSHRNRLATNGNICKTQMAATPFPGLPPFLIALGDDERLSVHPIGVTQLAQRADLELIDSSQREPTDRYLLGFGHRNSRR